MTDKPETPGLQCHVDAMAEWFRERLDPGERAALRRTRDPAREAAFWRVLLARRLDERSEPEQLAWAEVMRALAFLAEPNADLHDPTVPLGRALGRPNPAREGGGFTQLRFERLLSAQEERLKDEVRAAVRFLASKEAKVNVADLAALLLLAPDSEKGRQCRRLIAREYFKAIPRDDAPTP